MGLKSKNVVEFLLIQHFYDILTANNSWIIAQTPINNIIFWKCAMRTCRCICVNCFNRVRVFGKGSAKLRKKHFFGEFMDHNWKKRKLDKQLHYLFKVNNKGTTALVLVCLFLILKSFEKSCFSVFTVDLEQVDVNWVNVCMTT